MLTALRVLVLAGVLSGVGGCDHGDARSAEQQRMDRARFARAADDICNRTSRAIARDKSKPLTEDELALSVISSEHATQRGAAKLHKLHAELEASSSAAIDAFNAGIDRYLATFDALEGAPFASDRARAALRLRRSGAALFRAAQAAHLDRCGRGANAIAHRATFLNYRDAYFAIAGRETDRRLGRRLAAERSHGSDLDRYQKLEDRLLRELRFGKGPGENLAVG